MAVHCTHPNARQECVDESFFVWVEIPIPTAQNDSHSLQREGPHDRLQLTLHEFLDTRQGSMYEPRVLVDLVACPFGNGMFENTHHEVRRIPFFGEHVYTAHIPSGLFSHGGHQAYISLGSVELSTGYQINLQERRDVLSTDFYPISEVGLDPSLGVNM